MKKQSGWLIGLAVLTLFASVVLKNSNLSVVSAKAADSTKSDADQVRAVLEKYEESIDKADIGLASEVWSHSPEVTFIQPRGTDRGLKAVEGSFYKKEMGETFSERELHFENPSIHVYGDTAWADFTYTFHATFRADGKKLISTGRETQVQHKENGVWRIVLVHYSGPPLAAKGNGF